MVELADIFRIHGPQYQAKFKDQMLPSHLKVMQDIEMCRTESLGGQVYFCKECQDHHYSYHSCKNRHCPKCQNDNAQEWLERQYELLLPITHFMNTFTLPDSLRQLARSNQKAIYNILFKTSAAALQTLALDPKYVGGKIGMFGVLHTWTRGLMYHPHVHYVIPNGGLCADGTQWLSARKNFLMPVKALSIIFRAKFRDELKKTKLFNAVPTETWKKGWVVHSKPVGSGTHAFKYLAPYIFRVAISNRRILKLENGMVTFQYKESDTGKLKTPTIPAEEFIRRFLQHVLPDRFIKVRYYGIWSPNNRHLLNKAKTLLGVAASCGRTTCDRTTCSRTTCDRDTCGRTTQEEEPVAKNESSPFCCPKCGTVMVMVENLQPKKAKERRPP